MKKIYCYVLEEEIDESRCERTESPQCKKCTASRRPVRSKKKLARKQATHYVTPSRANSAQQKLSRRVFTPNRPTIKRQKPVARAYNELVLFTCYAQLLRWRYSDPKKLTPELIALAEAIKRWMEAAYAAIVKAFRNECKNGNKDVVHAALKALGRRAFDQEWFNEGLKDLLFVARKSVRLIPPEEILDFRDYYENMYQLEEKLQETTVDEATGQDETLKSQYYQDFPKKRDIANLHYCFFLLHPTLYTQVIEDLPVLDADTFCKLLGHVKMILPSFSQPRNLP